MDPNQLIERSPLLPVGVEILVAWTLAFELMNINFEPGNGDQERHRSRLSWTSTDNRSHPRHTPEE